MKLNKEIYGKQREVLSYFFSLIFSLIILIFQKQLSLYIFHTDLYQTVFVWFAVFLTFFYF